MPVVHRTMIGGQAVIEGVMMKGARNTAMAVRKPDGEINVDTWETKSVRDRSPVLRLPIVRGVVNFVEMLLYGYKTLMASAKIAGVEEEPSRLEQTVSDKFGEKALGGLMGLSSLVGLGVAVLLFVVLPSLVVKRTDFIVHYGVWKTVAEGVIKIAIFVGYLAVVSAMKDIRRVFEYHGAEHKTIACYEHNEELTAENVRKYRRFHPRCGTSFILIVLIIGIIVSSFVTWNSLGVRVLLKLALLPVVVGISYEVIKFAGRHDNGLMRFLLAPGLWLQRLTTREPDDSQMEVAISSLKAVLTDNKEDDRW